MSVSHSHHGRPVCLNVYDLIEKNDLLYDIGLGLVHSGVVVDGKEYSFGDGGGVIATKPKDISGVTFRETIFMGYTFLTPNEIHDVITNLKKTFRGDSYHLLNHNCNTFSNEFCKIIVGKEIPKHINRCANVANWFSGIGTRISKFVDDMDIKLPVFNEEPKTKLDVC